MSINENVCQYCEKTFNNKYILNKHMKSAKYCMKLRNANTHPGDDTTNVALGPVECEYCLKTFTQKPTLTKHYECCIEFVKYECQQKIRSVEERCDSQIKTIQEDCNEQLLSIRKECQEKVSLITKERDSASITAKKECNKQLNEKIAENKRYYDQLSEDLRCSYVGNFKNLTEELLDEKQANLKRKTKL